MTNKLTSTYSKFLLATDGANTHEENQTVYDAVVDWADSDAEFSMLHTVTPVTKTRDQLAVPMLSQMQRELLTDAETEIMTLAADAGIEGRAKILAQRFEKALQQESSLADKMTLAIVNNDRNNADLLDLQCDTLYVKQM